MIKIKDYTEQEELSDLNQHPLLFQHPFRLLITGPSGCGKTNLLVNLIKGFEKPKDLGLEFDALYICAKDIYEPKYSKLQEDYTFFDDIEEEDIFKIFKKNKRFLLQLFKKFKKQNLFSPYLDEFITVDDLDPLLKNLVIFDDCITEKDQGKIEDFFIRGRKKNASIIYISQSYYSTPINIRKNCNYFIFFKLQSREIKRIISEIDGGFKIKLYEKCVQKPYDFFMLDLKDKKKRYRRNFEPI